MKKILILYGCMLALLILILQVIDYRFLVHDISMEIYIGLIAIISTVIGIWMGLKLTRPKVIVQKEIVQEEFQLNKEKLKETGISQREYDVLELMSKGMSNKEIADSLFISMNTVKTHASNLFIKLDSKRRTQAILTAKELGLIP